MTKEEKIQIDLYLKKIGREDLKCDRLYKRSYQTVKDILEMPEWKKKRYARLLTSNIWKSTYEDIKNILTIPHPNEPDNPNKTIWDKKKFSKLLSPTIWNSNYEEVQNILTMKQPNNPENLIWDDERFKGLLTPSIWTTSYENISAKLALPFWANPLYAHLLTPGIWSISTKRIEDAIKTFEELGLQKIIKTEHLRKSSIQIKALYHYLVENKVPVIKNDKLHPIFNLAPKQLKDRYGLDIKVLIAQEIERIKRVSPVQ